MRAKTLLPSLALSLVAVVATPRAHAEDTKRAPVVEASTDAMDVIELTDGRRLEGVIVGENDRFVSLRAGGVLRAYPRTKVASIVRAERSETPLPPPITEPASKKDAKRAAKGKAKKGRAAKSDRIAELTPDARSWLLGLLERARSPENSDPAVRSSLSAAIQALGPAAEAEVRAAADTEQGESRAFLTKIADRMQAKSKKRSDAVRGKQRKQDGAAGEMDDPTMAGDAPGTGRTDSAKKGAAKKAAGSAGGAKSAREKLMALGLTPDQGREMREVLKEAGLTRREIYMAVRDGSATRADAQAEIAELRQASMETIAGILDASQFAEFETFAAEIFEGRRGGKQRQKKAGQKKAGKKQKKQDASE